MSGVIQEDHTLGGRVPLIDSGVARFSWMTPPPYSPNCRCVATPFLTTPAARRVRG